MQRWIKAEVLVVVLSVAWLAGCVPTSPVAPPVGLMLREGRPVMVFPTCPREAVLGARVSSFNVLNGTRRAWAAEGYRLAEFNAVPFTDMVWTQVDGTYDLSQRLELTVETTSAYPTVHWYPEFRTALIEHPGEVLVPIQGGSEYTFRPPAEILGSRQVCGPTSSSTEDH